LSGLKQRLIYRYLLYEFEQETHQDSDRWLEYTCSGILPVYIAVISFYIFFFGEKIGVYGTAIWMVLIIVSIAVDLFILQPTKILLKWIVIPSFAYEMIRKYYLHIRDQAKILLLRIRGSLNEDESLVQHLNPACRVARSTAQSFPSARLLVSLTDTDIPSTSQLNPSLVILPFIFVFRVFLTIVTIFPYPVQDCLFESIIISTFFSMIFLIVTYIKYSLFMIIFAGTLPTIAFLRECYEARRRRTNASQRLEDELDLSIESQSTKGRFEDEHDFIDSPTRKKKSSSSSSPMKKFSFYRSASTNKCIPQASGLDYDTSNHDSSDNGSIYDSNSFRVYENPDDVVNRENQSFVHPMRLGPKSKSMSPSKLSWKRSMKCHPVIMELTEEDEQPSDRILSSKDWVQGLSLDDIDSRLAGENYQDDANWSSDEDDDGQASKSSSLARSATFYDKMKRSMRQSGKVQPIISPMNNDFSISIVNSPHSGFSSFRSTPSNTSQSPIRQKKQADAGLLAKLGKLLSQLFVSSKPKPLTSPHQSSPHRLKPKIKPQPKSPSSWKLSQIDQVSDDYSSSSASPQHSPSRSPSPIRSPLKRLSMLTSMGLSMSKIIVEDFDYEDAYQQGAIPPLSLSSPLSQDDLNSFRQEFTKKQSMRRNTGRGEEHEVASATATATSHEVDEDIFMQINPEIAPDDASSSSYSSSPFKPRKPVSTKVSPVKIASTNDLISPKNQSFVIDLLPNSPQAAIQPLPSSPARSPMPKKDSSKLYGGSVSPMPPAPPSTTSPYRPPRILPLLTQSKPLTEEGVFVSELNPLSTRRSPSKRSMNVLLPDKPAGETSGISPSHQAFTIDMPALAPLKAAAAVPSAVIEQTSPSKTSSSTFINAGRHLRAKPIEPTPAIRSVMVKETAHVDKSMMPSPVRRDSSRFQPVNNLAPTPKVEDPSTEAVPADSASFDRVHTATETETRRSSVKTTTFLASTNLPSSPARMTRTLSQRMTSFRATEPPQPSTASESKAASSTAMEKPSNPHLNQDPTIYNLALLDQPTAVDGTSAMRVKYRKPQRMSLLRGEHEVDDLLRSQLLAIYGSSADSTINPDEDNKQLAADNVPASSTVPFQTRQQSIRKDDKKALQQSFTASDELSRIEADLSLDWNSSPTRASPIKKSGLRINNITLEDEEEDWEQYKASRVLYSPSKKRVPPPSSPSRESLPAKLRVSAALVAQMSPSTASPSRSKQTPAISSIHIPAEEIGVGDWKSEETDEWSRFKPMSVRYQKAAPSPSTKSTQQQQFFPSEEGA
jgi:hypothetical protein